MFSQNLKEKISKIKKLKLDNYLNNYFIHKTFYANYKTPKRILSSPNKAQNFNDKIFLSRFRTKNVKLFKTKSKSTNRILGINSNYMFYSPYVTKLIAGGLDSTEYDSTKYTLTKKEEIKNTINQPKNYFGIPGDTPLIRRATLSDLYSTTSLGFNTLSQVNSFSEKNIFQRANDKNEKIISDNDNDRKTAKEFFLDLYRNKNLKLFSKRNKKNLYEKFNINNKLTIEEESKINNIINRNKTDYKNLYPIFKSIISEESFELKTQTQVFDKQYKDPYNSCKKLKIKKQLMKIIEDLNINFQCEKFQKEFNSICELNNQQNRMHNIKVIPKKKFKLFKGFNAEQYLKKLDPIEQEEKTKKKSKKGKKNQIIFFHKPQTIYARGADLQEVELKVEYVSCIHHPEVRTQTAICYNEEKGEIYLFGGIEGRKLADLWQFNFSQIKAGWHKIYEPKKDSDYENEPCPRFGHTIHFHNKKIYLIGGEFENWGKNINREGILCVYDLKSKTWDMMKYNYDINWYNRKKEERRGTIKKRILSFQEITKSIENKKKENENNNNILNEAEKNNKNIENRNGLKDNKLERKKFHNKNIFSKDNNLRNIKESNKFLKSIKSTNDIISINKFNLENELKKGELNKSNNIYPELRRYHISLLIGTHILLYGGETPSNKTLNDCWLYDLKTQKWSLLEYIGRYPPPLCCHSACLVLEQNQLINEALNVYYKPPSEKKTLRLLKSDGVFFFGGYNESRVPTNLFFKIVIGVKPVIFEIPETMGLGPSPRIEASMNFNSENNLIVIYGGRNDLKNEVYNDITLLDMENMCWIKTIFWGEKPVGRSEHNAVVISNKLFVFGGVNNFNFINFDFTIFNLDFFAQKYAQKIEI